MLQWHKKGYHFGQECDIPFSKPWICEGNNSFKALKRIVYARSGLINLEKKYKLDFLPKN